MFSVKGTSVQWYLASICLKGFTFCKPIMNMKKIFIYQKNEKIKMKANGIRRNVLVERATLLNAREKHKLSQRALKEMLR